MTTTRWAAAMLAAGVGFALASVPALAQSGVPTSRMDLRPAAPTANAPPDGGMHYDYPPNTGSILRPQDRTPYDVPSNNPRSESSRALPTDAGTNPANKPAEQVGR